MPEDTRQTAQRSFVQTAGPIDVLSGQLCSLLQVFDHLLHEAEHGCHSDTGAALEFKYYKGMIFTFFVHGYLLSTWDTSRNTVSTQ